ncbi:MAG: DUF3341 domain-containing protein [Proteobacteria bacterium]|nr:DUF3341 domain-containing protein [Pseudomonadota bacterium]
MTQRPIGVSNSPGLIAGFADADTLLTATRMARERGLKQMDAYAPFAIDELPDALGLAPTNVRTIMFWCGLIGAAVGYLMPYYSAVLGYPINSGGRPLASWPAFLPIAFELAVLFAAVGGLVALFVVAGLSELHHPAFSVNALEAAGDDKFFLLVSSRDRAFNREQLTSLLRSAGALTVEEL